MQNEVNYIKWQMIKNARMHMVKTKVYMCINQELLILYTLYILYITTNLVELMIFIMTNLGPRQPNASMKNHFSVCAISKNLMSEADANFISDKFKRFSKT